MNSRPVKGTSDWKKYEIVLDIDTDVSNIAYGALISGTGQIWFDNITFEIVNNSVPTTNMFSEKNQTPSSPVNLNFEE
jgi:hypothetical protein